VLVASLRGFRGKPWKRKIGISFFAFKFLEWALAVACNRHASTVVTRGLSLVLFGCFTCFSGGVLDWSRVFAGSSRGFRRYLGQCDSMFLRLRGLSSDCYVSLLKGRRLTSFC